MFGASVQLQVGKSTTRSQPCEILVFLHLGQIVPEEFISFKSSRIGDCQHSGMAGKTGTDAINCELKDTSKDLLC